MISFRINFFRITSSLLLLFLRKSLPKSLQHTKENECIDGNKTTMMRAHVT